MYVILEAEGIINLNCFPIIDIVNDSGDYRLCAFTEVEGITDIDDKSIKTDFKSFSDRTITLDFFETEVDARYALWHLFNSLEKNVNTWDRDEVEKPSEIWEEIKTKSAERANWNIPKFLETTELKVSGLHKFIIQYDKKSASSRVDSIIEYVNDSLRNKLLLSIEIEWKPKEHK